MTPAIEARGSRSACLVGRGAVVAAFYKKLNGTEPAVSTALVAHSFARGRELVTEISKAR